MLGEDSLRTGTHHPTPAMPLGTQVGRHELKGRMSLEARGLSRSAQGQHSSIWARGQVHRLWDGQQGSLTCSRS